MNGELITKIKKKQVRITVVGLGHVGLPIAAVFADAGFLVIGTDIRSQLVKNIMSRTLKTHEPELDDLVKKIVEIGKFKAVVETAYAASQTEVALICVQTPLNNDRKPDLRYIRAASREVARGLTKEKLAVVVSTVPPGTVKTVVGRILEEESGLKCGSDFGLAYSPERILPGNTLEELRKNVRLVGGVNSESTEATVELFKRVTRGRILVTDIANAELAKLAENTFRYVNIALANELALICENMGADVSEVIGLANTHPRVNIHRPGIGVGGPCLTKDPQLLLHQQGRRALTSKIIEYSEEANISMPDHTINLVVKAVKNSGKRIRNSNVAVLGIAYKAEVGDTTNSPSIAVIKKLMKLASEVRVYDPYSEESFGARRKRTLNEAVKGADCIVVATDHKMFADLPLKKMKKLMKENPVIVDARRIVDLEKAKREGFVYYGIGLGTK